MADLKFKIGDKLRVKTGSDVCGNWRDHSKNNGTTHILITDIRSGYYCYDICDNNGFKLGRCRACLKDQHLEYYNQIEEGFIKNMKEYQTGDIISNTAIVTAFSAEAQGHRKKGEKFIAVTEVSDRIKKFQVVELNYNDGSSNPEFKLNEQGHTNFISWRLLAELPQGMVGEPKKPEITGTVAYYSDGVKVTETHVEFDGKNWDRTELKEVIKRYTEILKRPLAVVTEASVPAAKKKAAPRKKATTKVKAPF